MTPTAAEAAPPTDLADANRYWERHEGERILVPGGSIATSGRDVFASTADSEVWLIRPDDPLAARGLSDHDPQVARFASRATLSVADTAVVEGNSGRRAAVFTVGFSRPLGQDITVCLVPFGITAFPIVDFDLRLPYGTLVAGDTAIDLGIPVRGDRQRERDETFGVVALATGGVRHDDPLATATTVNDD